MRSPLSPTNEACEEDLRLLPKPSIELVLTHSDEVNEFEGVLSDDADESTPALEAACRLVKALLDQVAWNDAPAHNEDLFSQTRTKSNAGLYSKQCHVPPFGFKSPSLSPLSAPSANDLTGNPTDLWNNHYERRSKQAEKKLGNVSLATLCARTLETVGKSSLPSKEVTEMEQNMDAKAGKSRRSTVWKRAQRIQDRQGWRRRKKRTEANQHFGEIEVSQEAKETSPRKPTSKIVGKDRTFLQVNSNEEEIPSDDRLQMFGSEYARHLSSTVLAPKEKSSGKGGGLPRPNITTRRHASQNIINIEDCDSSFLTGPITDIVITFGQDAPPKGFFRVSRSTCDEEFLLRDRKVPAYLNVKKEKNWDRAAQRPCVTALALIFPQRKEFVPPGFSVVRRYSPTVNTADRHPANLNVGNEHAFLCFRRSREGNPITGLLPILPSNQEYIPDGYTVLERTPRNHVASLQTTKGIAFLAYRQRLANLELLRPLPLVMSLRSSTTDSKHLNAYYCTGGTIVESRVGRFHIMDRSTHSLLSPSSISNRLAMIEASRRKTLNTISGLGDNYVYSIDSKCSSHIKKQDTITSSILLIPGLGTPRNSSFADMDKTSSLGDDNEQYYGNTLSLLSYGSDNHNSSIHSRSTEISSKNTSDSVAESKDDIYDTTDDEFERCLEALSFIPVVSTALDENDPNAMLRFQARVAVLTPILTACYTRHGGSCLLAVEGLTNLLFTDFFSNDVYMENDASSRVSLLDISVQVVCDVATMGTHEMQLQPCVDFVQAAVELGCGQLTTRTVGYVMRFYQFVFYFGVTTATSVAGAWGCTNGRDHYLLEDPRRSGPSYLPGGASQASVLSLKDLISFSIDRLRALLDHELMMFRLETPKNDERGVDVFNRMINGILDDVIDQSVHRVEIANYTQLAMHQIRRSGGSELFWYDMMNSCGSGLFGNDKKLSSETRNAYSTLFALLAACVKTACTRIRKDKNSDGVPRDIATKMMSFEMLRFFLLKFEKDQRSSAIPDSHSFETFLFSIRRLVVPCLLSNTREAVNDPRIYRRILQLVGVLWSSSTYRKYMKFEVGILMEHFVIRILRLAPQILYKQKPKDDEDMTYLFAQQIELMRSLRVWFSDSRSLLELFVNFDAKLHYSLENETSNAVLTNVHWKTTQKIISALCTITDNCGEFLADQVRESTKDTTTTQELDTEVIGGMSGTTLARESAQKLLETSIATVEQIIRSLAECAAASRSPRFRSVIDSWSSTMNKRGDNPESFNDDSAAYSDQEDVELHKDVAVLGFWHRAKKQKEEEMNAQYDLVDNDTFDHIKVATEMAMEKSLHKAVQYLIACNVLTPSPRDIASFLRLHRASFDAKALRKYLGENGMDASETEYWNLIRFCYIRAISFVGMTVEQGLRHLLTSGGFRLPGEAQQIDRIITTFAQCFWEDNAGDTINCPFDGQDALFLLSFAIIMLNTDLHRSTEPMSGKKKHGLKKMKCSEFISNLKRASSGMDKVSDSYLSSIYDSIEAHPMVLLDEDNSSTNDGHPISRNEDIAVSLSMMVNDAQNLEALLRALSTQKHRFITIEMYGEDPRLGGDLKRATSSLVRSIFLQTWHEFHGLVNGILERAHLDLSSIESAGKILRYALSLTICLDLSMERTAFLSQLGRLHMFHAWRRGEAKELSTAQSIENYKHEDWYTGILEACDDHSTASSRKKLMALKLIDDIVNDMGVNISTNRDGVIATRTAVRHLANAEYLLNDPSRSFLQTGNLLKRANRSGRLVEYRFFLFSDILIYAKQIPHSTQYRIHEELPLILMKVVDWFPPQQKKETKKGFQIYHPRKTFMVYASTQEDRSSWVAAIRAAIDKEVFRKMNIEAARKVATSH